MRVFGGGRLLSCAFSVGLIRPMVKIFKVNHKDFPSLLVKSL